MSLPANAQRNRGRAQDERIYLDHADSLYYDEFRRNDTQVVRGNVKFRHRGSVLYCDSAYFKQQENTFHAFGHVRLLQGDTLEIKCDTAFYDGRNDADMVHAQHNVLVVHRKTSELRTDNLILDQKFNIVYYDEGGNYVDKSKGLMLSSDWGKYNLDTKEAEFFYKVKLRTKTHVITTDTLYYYSQDERALVKGGKTEFENGRRTWSKSTIHSIRDGYDVETTNCVYFMKTDSKVSHGFGRVNYEDRKNKNRLIADAVDYNELDGTGMATKNPVYIDYSQQDTLYLHADTIRVETFNLNTDSLYRKVHCYHKVRMFRNDVQAVCDSMVICTLDSTITLYYDPIVWNTNHQLLGDSIRVFLNDSTVREAHVMQNALSLERMQELKDPDKVYYNQVASQRMNAYFVDGNIRMSEAIRNVMAIYYPVDESDSSLVGMVYVETDTMRMYVTKQKKLDRIWTSKAEGIMYPVFQIPSGKDYLPNFGWYDYIRPLNKDDIYYIEEKHKKKTSANIPPL